MWIPTVLAIGVFLPRLRQESQHHNYLSKVRARRQYRRASTTSGRHRRSSNVAQYQVALAFPTFHPFFQGNNMTPKIRISLPLWYVLKGKSNNHYDLFRMSDGSLMPAPMTLWQFLPLFPRGRDRDKEFFECPQCGEKSFFSPRRNGCYCGLEGDHTKPTFKIRVPIKYHRSAYADLDHFPA